MVGTLYVLRSPVLKYVKGIIKGSIFVHQSNKAIGQSGEDHAVVHIKQAGLTVLFRNYRCPQGEMDIIARDGLALVFIEVRSRSSGRCGWGEETITPQKRARLNRIASHYIKFRGFKNWPPMRFDLIAIRSGDDPDKHPDIYWIRGI
jgi:putative endonuclease